MGLADVFRMDGQVAVVTGSGQGIGRGIACGLADFGCDVVINARRVADLEQTAEAIRERGGRVLVVPGDIRDFSEQLADAALAEFGRLDIWVNNVGGGDEKQTRALVDMSDEIWRSQIELNLTTAFQGCRAAATRMRDGGSIINIASGAGMRASPWTGAYAAAKAGMLNLTQTLSLELAPSRIRVNAVSPGPVATEAFQHVVDPSAFGEMAATVPLGRLGTPDDIATAVIYLASAAASWVSGQNILVAGGRTVRGYQYTPKPATS